MNAPCAQPEHCVHDRLPPQWPARRLANAANPVPTLPGQAAGRAGHSDRPLIKALRVPRPGHTGAAAMARALPEHLRTGAAPCHTPRVVPFVSTLPRTETGKLQRCAPHPLTHNPDPSKPAATP
ncbi:AMP-binding enzyme [Verminephrobacter eiseniae]|uniref:AMP-binding enzyme C-terminal domain-containing protein n=1 Tax=Verminephrobacter eiseniae (strain EF01-2) TaxID=391735 RepID=A1WF74_VEREI|nr:hypothetical protein [Verminephrobacter eiseniae]ABM56281.1 hypothetical protein Veis_0497 [Verminephrobacter eiseniae EF01-2]MCW5286645.1 hypothetical protein [Verminephrobacter eiseniae]MCW5304943.1 hypothetical protein [Verminephrobacter eiseniae]MCW8181073.1 hypothetical protein [Verminephrobacter eiseniae]MCW8192657.1 hypothetical protein [Verminephrobacter eiseniae]